MRWSFAMWSPLRSSVFILDRNEGFAFFPGYSSWFSGLFSFFSSWALVLSSSALGYIILRLGGSRVECSSLPHSFL